MCCLPPAASDSRQKDCRLVRGAHVPILSHPTPGTQAKQEIYQADASAYRRVWAAAKASKQALLYRPARFWLGVLALLHGASWSEKADRSVKNVSTTVKHSRTGLLRGRESIEDGQECGDDVSLAHLDVIEHDGCIVRVERQQADAPGLAASPATGALF